MSSPWEPGVAQSMQRHGGSHHSKPKVVAPKIAPDAAPAGQPPMEEQGAPLVPEPSKDEGNT